MFKRYMKLAVLLIATTLILSGCGKSPANDMPMRHAELQIQGKDPSFYFDFENKLLSITHVNLQSGELSKFADVPIELSNDGRIFLLSNQ